MNKKILLCFLLGLLGALLGLADAEFARISCYYASTHEVCSAQLGIVRYALEISLGFVLFYMAGFWIYQGIVFIRQKLMSQISI